LSEEFLLQEPYSLKGEGHKRIEKSFLFKSNLFAVGLASDFNG